METRTYRSAPCSPGRSRSNTVNGYFLSVPTSPCGHESEARTFRFGCLVYEDGDEEEMPIMAYADELFCGGRMVPLKLPPRLQSYTKESKSNGRMMSSSCSSPGSTSLRLKIPFRVTPRLWNNEFDPFMTALEKVKKTKNPMVSPLKWGRSKSMGPDGPAHITSQAVVEGRKERLKRFLLKSATLGWKTNKLEKQEERRTSLLLSPHHHHHHRSSMEPSTARQGNAVLRISRGIKSLLKQNRPSLFCRTLCAPKMC